MTDLTIIGIVIAGFIILAVLCGIIVLLVVKEDDI